MRTLVKIGMFAAFGFVGTVIWTVMTYQSLKILDLMGLL